MQGHELSPKNLASNSAGPRKTGTPRRLRLGFYFGISASVILFCGLNYGQKSSIPRRFAQFARRSKIQPWLQSASNASLTALPDLSARDGMSTVNLSLGQPGAERNASGEHALPELSTRGEIAPVPSKVSAEVLQVSTGGGGRNGANASMLEVQLQLPHDNNVGQTSARRNASGEHTGPLVSHSCFATRPDKTCLPQPCSGKGSDQALLIGSLAANGTWYREEKTQFDFQGQCAVSLKHRFVFVHVLTSEGSLFHDFFVRSLCPSVNGKFQCADDVFKPRYCHAAAGDTQLQDFFWFGFVRHPFSRAISAWQMAHQPKFLHGHQVPFERFAMDTDALKTQTRLMPMHWRPQNIFITTGGNCPVVDFIGKLESGGRFERDLEFVLGRIGSETLWREWKTKGFPHENKEAGDKRRGNEAKSMIKGAVAEELYKRYEKDFVLFGFDRHDAEYGQPYTPDPVSESVGLADLGAMDAHVVANVTSSMISPCFVAMGDVCFPTSCNGPGSAPLPFIGSLKASNAVDRTKAPKFSYALQCAVSIKHRFIFVHVPKAGGSSFHDFFRGAMCKKVEGRRCDDEEAFKLMGCGAAVGQHPDFFKFCFVRHPFARAVSSWQMALRQGFLLGPRMPFNEWAMDPSKLQTRLMAMHWFPQHQFVTTKGDCPLVDFVGVLGGRERFERDLEFVLGRIGSETLWREWKTKGFPHENKEAGDKRRGNEAKSMIKGAVAEELYKRYEKDFVLFGFDRHDAEYGQPYTPDPVSESVGLADLGAMDAHVVANVTSSMITPCFRGIEDVCFPTSCNGSSGSAPLPFIGSLKASNAVDRTKAPKFDFVGQCAVSIKHRFIFVHVPKAGGSSFHDFFRGAMCKKVEWRRCDDEEAFKLMDCGAAVGQHPDFFKFCFVRHPFARAVSSWQMALRQGFLLGPRMPFNEWAMDPSKLQTRLMAMHWFPQHQFVTTKGDCPLVDFVGVLGGRERFERDLEFVLGRIGSETLWREWKTKGFPHENKEAGDKRRGNEAKSMIKGAVAEELYKRYEKDFVLFGFDRHDAEYGQPYTPDPVSESVGLADLGAMDAHVVANVTSSMITPCFRGIEDVCFPTSCNGSSGSAPLPFIGSLKASNAVDRTKAPKFDFVGQCAVSIKHRFIFVHVPKAGGSSFHDFFRGAMCKKVEGRRCDDEEAFKLMGCGAAVGQHPDFFKFCFVRHPFARAVSSWQMALRQGFLLGPRMPFNEWAMDPSKLQTRLMAMHWFPQHQFVTTKGDCPLVDFVGVLGGRERFERDLEFVLGRIGSETLWREWKTKGFPHENKEAGDKRRGNEAKSMIKGAVAEELYKRYEKDFVLFGFDRHDAEYGQPYTPDPVSESVGLADLGAMDAHVVANVTSSMITPCFRGIEDVCFPTSCNGSSGSAPLPFIGSLKASNAVDRTKAPKFTYALQCAVSIKHRFIFVHVPKAGGSSFHDFFRGAMCKKVEGRRCDDEEAFKLMGCGAAVGQHPDFFKFCFVRHPFARAVSSWQMALRQGFLLGPRMPFNEWAMDPSKLQTRLMAMHWFPQHQFVTTKGDCPLVDFVGVLGGRERFERDLEFVLGRIGSETLWREWKTKGFPHENKEAGDKRRGNEAKSMIKGAVAEELYKRYEKDFVLFGFDRHDAEYGQPYTPDPASESVVVL